MPRLLGFVLALIVLSLGVALTAGLLYVLRDSDGPHLPLWVAAIMAGALAMSFGWRLLPSWWRPVLLVMPLAALLSLTINPIWFLLAALVLMALQWNAIFNRIPLYRSDEMVSRVIADLMAQEKFRSLLDIGCGDGRLLLRLSKALPDAQFVGVESAPVLYLVARWRCRKQANCVIHFGDFWKLDWSPYDVVFAFLSPEPMLRVWRKAGREMEANAVLLSLAFVVPGIEESRLVPAQHFDMYLYQLPVLPDSDH
jgi:SAM-dependent methyltransferase